MSSGRKTLTITNATYERLKSFGSFGESFDDLLNKLMDNMKKRTINKIRSIDFY